MRLTPAGRGGGRRGSFRGGQGQGDGAERQNRQVEEALRGEVPVIFDVQTEGRKVPVVVGPMTAVPDGDAPYDAVYANPGAPLATAYGLDPEEALRTITLNPARTWGVADRIGSIEPGKVAISSSPTAIRSTCARW